MIVVKVPRLLVCHAVQLAQQIPRVSKDAQGMSNKRSHDRGRHNWIVNVCVSKVPPNPTAKSPVRRLKSFKKALLLYPDGSPPSRPSQKLLRWMDHFSSR